MPEGDTVFRTVARLRDALTGDLLTVSDFRVPRYATVDLTGLPVESVVARGKHILIRVPDFSIHSHLKMEGEWHVYEPGSRWRKPGFRARVVLSTARAQAVGFDLGIVEVLPRERESDAVGHLGPDLLGPDWDPARAEANLAQDPDRPIGTALLDQRVMAGLGNVYRCELCFLRGVDPRTPVREAGDPARWVELAHRVINANRERATRVTTGDLRRGRNLWVYGRRGRPCLRCGTPIEFGRLGTESDPDRVIYRCPACQPLHRS
ncbi:DNA-formamidopyrimidine glycosylase family protein [Rhodococcus chondri]|uniref:DNA-(apurinic or apyrimidinic site) lyase n=1 Tax=Rhodococcus chondri TaxID=3065941 RepID=A0ABU7JXP9_9NOCA|nr:DNA-formamidopyrimidine glycosylase family protein [Rhodococcus sp. CC-R104]MEE2034689.1 DNA-formamidopyrimidine glycosylase family protein [Rhodococcus sp. CC-R104]